MKSGDYHAFTHVTGMTDRHHYVGTILKDDRIEISFLRLPLPPFVIPLEGYREEMKRRVFTYLTSRHTNQVPDERLKFEKFLDCSDGIYGTHHAMHPCNLEIGFIQLCTDATEQDVEITRG